MNRRLHIERLVLRGFTPLEARRVRESFAAALAAPDEGPALGAAAHHDELRLVVRDPGTPEALGRAAAQALLRTLQR
jgi:hypothetical protein